MLKATLVSRVSETDCFVTLTLDYRILFSLPFHPPYRGACIHTHTQCGRNFENSTSMEIHMTMLAPTIPSLVNMFANAEHIELWYFFGAKHPHYH